MLIVLVACTIAWFDPAFDDVISLLGAFGESKRLVVESPWTVAVYQRMPAVLTPHCDSISSPF